MSHILIIAYNAFRETIRDKILYNLVFFTLMLIAFSYLLGEWSVFARENVIKEGLVLAHGHRRVIMAESCGSCAYVPPSTPLFWEISI